MIVKFPEKFLGLREKLLVLFTRYSVPRWMVFMLDSLAVFFVFLFSYLLQFNFEYFLLRPETVFFQALITTLIYALYSLLFRSYAELLRHTTLSDISLVFMVDTSAALTIILVSLVSRVFNLHAYLLIPVDIALIHYVSITVFLFFIRIFIKIVFRYVNNPEPNKWNVLVYGADEPGFIVKRIVMSDPKFGYMVVGFIDKNKSLHGKTINGIEVYGESVLNKEFISRKNIQSLILADCKITVDEKSNLIRRSLDLGLEVLETPEVDKWLNGQINARQFQRVKVEDLLGRTPIRLNRKKIREGLNNKTIMITGAAGSIGSEITRQLARFSSKTIILVDQAETPLFYLENELREKFMDMHFYVFLADVTNREKMELLFKKFNPEIVFHAAAYKHVPLIEANPHEAVRVNVGGTKVMTELAIRYKAEKFVMISTDKSVNPTSIMGASKRVCEKLVQSMSKAENCQTQFIVTRFGNVLGSNGSVIPLFSKQIQAGGPVTVTHPEIYRYFMTIPEACQLVLEAGFMGEGGEIFVFDMGEPVKIADLAKSMIMLSGHIPGKDIQIQYTGLRPGEKLYEELLTDKETTIPTHHPKIKKARVEIIEEVVVLKAINDILKNLYAFSKKELVENIKELVPEYRKKPGDKTQVDILK